MNIKAVKYLGHITSSHMKMTGEQLAFYRVPCPTCASMLVKRNRKGTDIMFVACDKTNLPYCKFSIGMNEMLEERSRRIYNKLRHKDIIDVEPIQSNRLNGFSVIKL
ncbi:hypothetical protein P4G96_26425 [Bacillus cereus]|nr:hypothetical protein [Bacillus cereus]MEB8670653.1 hypothetical protein [Bacillus cereus]